MTYFPINEMKIIPVHMNCIFSSEYLSFYSNLNKERLRTIFQELNNDETYVLDFTYIRNAMISDSIEYFGDLLPPKKILMINLEFTMYNKLFKYFEGELSEYESLGLKNCLKTKNFFSVNNELSEMNNFKYIKDYLKEKSKNNIRKTDEPKLISSNVYTNKIFDMRRLFGDMNTVKAVVYLMALKLKELENDPNMVGYKLISSSLNGCILANIIAFVMMKEHISIPHLGPEIAMEDNRCLKYIKRNDKFVYIYDFIALGNEQKTISVVAKLLKAEVICSLGLVYYRPSQKQKDTTHSLIDFNDIISDIHITAEIDDLNRLLENENA